MARWDPPHVINRVKLFLHTKILGTVALFLLLVKVPFLAFLNIEMGVTI